MANKLKYTQEVLEQIVPHVTSYSALLRGLGLTISGGNFRSLKHRIAHYQMDTSHFTGQAWTKGKSRINCKAIDAVAVKNEIPIEQVFVKHGCPIENSKLRKLIFRFNLLPYKCVLCDLVEWLGKKLTLHLDHINGDSRDNRLENLRFLCPNCHQQTETWGRVAKPVVAPA